MKLKRTIKVSAALLALTLLCAGFACNKVTVERASTSVNRYAESLSAFQDAEIKLHEDGKVSDALHLKILNSETAASRAGRNLNAAIGVAAKNGDASQYIELAQKTFNEMLATVQSDATARAQLELTVNVAGDALKNAISLINALKTKPQQSQNGGHSPMWAFWLLPMIGMAAAGGVAGSQLLQLLEITVQLEPIAFDLILKLSQSLKGKTPDEIRALSDSIFDKVEQTAQAEIDKLAGTTRVSPK